MTDLFRLDPDGFLRSELLDGIGGIDHGFGTRFSALPSYPLATVKQVHSPEILEIREPGLHGEGDALLTNRGNLAIAVKTADCVPILLFDAEHHVIAAIHAGWRGTVREIPLLTVERMKENYKTKPANLFAALGPAIGPCCFEVGPEVAREFAKWDVRLSGTHRKEFLDLSGTCAHQLRLAGVPDWHMARSNLCTVCRADILYSYRKEKEKAGRMLSWIGTQAK